MTIRTTFHVLAAVAVMAFVSSSLASQTAERIYLSGKGPSEAVEWDFFCSKGRQSGEWMKILVPSNWEQHGFGNYNYGHDDPDTKHDEEGIYRTTFFVPKDWKDNHVRLVFEGSMTETSIKINGRSVGATNFGGYVPFSFILDKHNNIEYGKENELEVLVKKKPSNRSLDLAERKADYWVLGGIYRPVYLEVLPKDFTNRVAIDARADGTFKMDVFPQVQRVTKFRKEVTEYLDEVVAQIETKAGVAVGEPMRAVIHSGTGRVALDTKIANPKTWSPEYPNLYQVKVTLKFNGKVLHEKVEPFGFRTIELRPQDGFYLNGKKILIQGVNRNVFDPKHGRAIDAEEVWNEARMIKAMNVNLVRSHLPPTFEFMRACDELGMMVITELTNWHDPYIDTPIARNIAYELVTRYQNHPSVILWANGNENGFNLEIDELYHLYDLQDRPVIHPWTYFEGIDTLHYPNYAKLLEKLAGASVYLPTEFLHGLYDGGHGAGMEDYWAAIRASDIGAGGVLWCWADAALSRTDLDGKLDTSGNRSADGVVGPYGEKEASYFSVREIWSPIQIDLKSMPVDFKGVLPIENRYLETPLSECSFSWKLVDVPSREEGRSIIRTEGSLVGPNIKPGRSGSLKLALPKDWKTSDVLELSAVSRDGVEVMQWSWAIHEAALEVEAALMYPKYKDGSRFIVESGDAIWEFSPDTGKLLRTSTGSQDAGLTAGPNLYLGNADGPIDLSTDWDASSSKEGGSIVIESISGRGSSFTWTFAPNGVVRLDYAFVPVDSEVFYAAVGFDLDEGLVEGKRWLGKGPHRVWGNRMIGPQVGLWENEYNNVVTGQNWGQTEFKGIFSDVSWMNIDLNSGASLEIDAGGEAELGILRPEFAEGVLNKNTFAGPVHSWWHYPQEGGLHLFHKLPGVGTKFANAEDLGPQGSPSVLSGLLEGSVVFGIK